MLHHKWSMVHLTACTDYASVVFSLLHIFPLSQSCAHTWCFIQRTHVGSRHAEKSTLSYTRASDIFICLSFFLFSFFHFSIFPCFSIFPFSFLHFLNIFFVFFSFHFSLHPGPRLSPPPKKNIAFSCKNLNFKEDEKERRTRRQKQFPCHSRTHRTFVPHFD